jgi:hypothetical protein
MGQGKYRSTVTVQYVLINITGGKYSQFNKGRTTIRFAILQNRYIQQKNL